jgi:hypothetical protein
MRAFLKGGIHGKAKAAFGCGVVERGCEESAEFCEGEDVTAAGSKEAASYARRGRAEGDEAQDPVSIDQKEKSLGFRR